MNKRQVVEFLKQGEGINCEFKEAYDQLPKNLFETICSFLNTDGGTIFLGITDKGEISGINPTKVIQIKNDLTNLSNNPKKIDLPYLLFPQDIDNPSKEVRELSYNFVVVTDSVPPPTTETVSV